MLTKNQIINISTGKPQVWLTVCNNQMHLSENHPPMLTKTHSFINLFARRKEEVIHKELTRKQWIAADRIVMIVLFISVIIGAIIFS